MEKTRGQKSHASVPLIQQSFFVLQKTILAKLEYSRYIFTRKIYFKGNEQNYSFLLRIKKLALRAEKSDLSSRSFATFKLTLKLLTKVQTQSSSLFIKNSKNKPSKPPHLQALLRRTYIIF